jgi:hypothetical protein
VERHGIGRELDGCARLSSALSGLDFEHGVLAPEAPGSVQNAVKVARVKDMLHMRPTGRELVAEGFPRVGIPLECLVNRVGFASVLGAAPAMHLCASRQCGLIHKGAERMAEIEHPSD